MSFFHPPMRAVLIAFMALCVASTARADSIPVFAGTIEPLSPGLMARMTSVSWNSDCPVPLSDLRLLTVSHWGFDTSVHTGVLVLHKDVAEPVLGVMRRLFEARFPIRRMRLIDDYEGDDDRSVEADNTSAFNGRRATGQRRWSNHAYGRAVDINPIENPYVCGGRIMFPVSAPYLDRTNIRPGMAYRGGVLVSAFRSIGWRWGGSWTRGTRDYQHFSPNGR